MVLQWLSMFLTNCFNKQPEVIEQTTLEMIDSLLIHFKKMPVNKTFNKFMSYELPCKTYRDYKSIVGDFFISMEYLRTPKTIKLQTIKYNDVNYFVYFKRGLNDVYTRDDAKAEMVTMLNKLRKLLSSVQSSQPENYLYYSSRSEIIIAHCVSILEILTHE